MIDFFCQARPSGLGTSNHISVVVVVKEIEMVVHLTISTSQLKPLVVEKDKKKKPKDKIKGEPKDEVVPSKPQKTKASRMFLGTESFSDQIPNGFSFVTPVSYPIICQFAFP